MRSDHDLWSLLCKNLRHVINFPFAKGEGLCLLFIMVEAKKSNSVDRGGLDKIEDSSRSYTASFGEMSGHRERIVANHVEPGSEMDLLGRSPKITECHDVPRVLGEATCARNERTTTQGNDDRLMGDIDRFLYQEGFPHRGRRTRDSRYRRSTASGPESCPYARRFHPFYGGQTPG